MREAEFVDIFSLYMCVHVVWHMKTHTYESLIWDFMIPFPLKLSFLWAGFYILSLSDIVEKLFE